MAKGLIITITEHRYFGLVLTPYIIERQRTSFFTVNKQVTSAQIQKGDISLSEAEVQLITLLENNNDYNIAKRFAPRMNSTDFLKKLSKEAITANIRPFLEKNMAKALMVIQEAGIPLYLKKPNYNNLYESDRVVFEKEHASAIFHFDRSSNGLSYSLNVRHQDRMIGLTNRNIIMLTDTPCHIIINNRLFFFNGINGKKLQPFFSKNRITVPPSAEKRYMESFVLNCIRLHEVEAQGFSIRQAHFDATPILTLVERLDGNGFLKLDFRYDKKLFPPNSSSPIDVTLEKQNGSYTFFKFARKTKLEAKTQKSLAALKLSCFEENQFSPLSGEAIPFADLISWVNHNALGLEKAGFEIQQEEEEERKYHLGVVNLQLQIDDNIDWFDIHGAVQIGSFKIPFIRFRKHLVSKSREYLLPDGTWFIIPSEWFTKYRDMFGLGEKKGDSLRLGKIHFNLVKECAPNMDSTMFSRFEELTSEANHTQLAAPNGLNAQMRAYQQEGFSWMVHLYQKGFGGCLADDMGLGKTLQTLAMLQSIYGPHQKQKSETEGEGDSANNVQPLPASLIVMPTSLIHNWENEIKKFTPNLLCYNYSGTKRIKSHDIGKILRHYHVVITSYGVARNDVNFLQDYRFHHVILDESQNIKNPSSKIYQAITALQADYRLVLTGTPIENSLVDLWAQVNFINDGLLGNLNYFKNNFVTPITRGKNEEQQEKLQKIIAPFILRRTKKEVAKDLPPLMEQVLYCDMTAAQKKIYLQEKSSIRNSVLETLEKQGMEKSAIMALQGLTRLRLLANHPVLGQEDYKGDSGKFERVIRNLENLRAENHKVLVFSSFVKHLNLLEAHFIKNKWNYSILTGHTVKRKEVISRFQQEKDNQVFLISLKAGGVGLNLTEADYVFILDPWWNPAAEMQAINRAHRIGQDKKVMVYRYISNETIEEKISHLQAQKAQLADTFINSNNPFKNLTKKELEDLFR